MIRPPEQDLRGQVPAQLPTEGAGNDNWLERKLYYPGGNIPPAPLTLDDEQFSFLDSEGHSRTIVSEQKAKVYLRELNKSVGVFVPLEKEG